MTPPAVDEFLTKFLTPPTGKTPADTRGKILHWLGVANDPKKLKPDAGPYELAARRKTARQNLRKLIERHPSIAAQIMDEREVEK